ncbi:hypothetical protein JL49_07685 [Pseudoalteromonas luteoviolacea]|uniref:Short-chain dehydrogenase n=2 Tax=Pseudoalteromonas luteoviolacea TaxID=43657 RepID=A0A166Y5A2_9GAMM|nr:SDR family NAD(P)-dependent oxidoreductase [Pseudoalteromonas luteoviolacea]KZN41462.1 hypothetical protein N482_03935 [Pseudoalteromonas luteoviolacea NCIMB 1942]KZX01120.1 hypothetical protein JL49_07685 [Pseudoalteromonas luteoviolacea]
MFGVNVLALLNTMQSVLAPMKARRGGTIVYVSSIAGKKTFPNHAAYCQYSIVHSRATPANVYPRDLNCYNAPTTLSFLLGSVNVIF